MNFVVDEQLPPALAAWISGRGHSARHVGDSGLRSADNVDVWAVCVDLPAVIVTKDEDFVARRARTEAGPQVLWVRLGNATNDVLLDWPNNRWAGAIVALQAGATIVELR